MRFKRAAKAEKAEQAKAKLLEMEAKRQEIERKREIAYQKELKEKKQRERQERDGERPAPSGVKRLKDKLKKKGGSERAGDGKLPLKKRTEEEKKLDKIPSIKKKVKPPVTKAAASLLPVPAERKKRKPLAQIMASIQGEKREKPVTNPIGKENKTYYKNRLLEE